MGFLWALFYNGPLDACLFTGLVIGLACAVSIVIVFLLFSLIKVLFKPALLLISVLLAALFFSQLIH